MAPNDSVKVSPKSAYSWLYPLLITLVLAYLIKHISPIYWGFEWNSFTIWGLYLGLYGAISALFKLGFGQRAKQARVQHPAESWPYPGPLARYGKWLVAVFYLLSTLLTVLNPFLLIQQFRHLIGQFAASRRLAKKNIVQLNEPSHKYQLPFTGEWVVFQGGMSEQTSHSWQVLNQRFAYDFVRADQNFSRHINSGTNPKDYFCYGAEIVAAADGEVIAVQNSIGDSPFAGLFIIDFLCRHAAGNYLIIKHAEGEYGFYAHMIKSSIAVKVGDLVKQGERLGLCGFSGNSTEPHLHFHLQDGPDFYSALGIPICFENILVDQKKYSTHYLERGCRVANQIYTNEQGEDRTDV